MKNKLALGTVQFGLDYGINNPEGRVRPEKVKAILKLASESGIDMLDTAYAYGESENILGRFLPEFKNSFHIISKFPVQFNTSPEKIFEESLRRLGVNSIYGYLFHDIKTYRQNPEIWDEFRRWKAEGKVKKIGFSVYYPDDLEKLMDEGVRFDIAQFPYSIFDRRFERILPLLKDKHVEVHARSVFLQGLFFRELSKLEGRFQKIRGKIEYLRKLSSEYNIPVSAVCLNFVLLNNLIDRTVIGIDNIGNLQENLDDMNYIDKVKQILSKLAILIEEDENIILPFNWK